MKPSILLLLFASIHLSCSPANYVLSFVDNARKNDRMKSISSGVYVAKNSAEITGGFIGACLDEQDRYVLQANSPATLERMELGIPLTIQDIRKLHESGINDNIIIDYIQGTRSSYNLSQKQIKVLQDAGISQRLLNYIIDTGR